MEKQPEALRLADALDYDPMPMGWYLEAAAELRRLHEEVTLLREQNTELDARLAQMEGKTRPATRDEKIVRPGVYEVPVRCDRCGEINPADIHTCSPQVSENAEHHARAAVSRADLGNSETCDIQAPISGEKDTYMSLSASLLDAIGHAIAMEREGCARAVEDLYGKNCGGARVIRARSQQ